MPLCHPDCQEREKNYVKIKILKYVKTLIAIVDLKRKPETIFKQFLRPKVSSKIGIQLYWTTSSNINIDD